MLVERACFRPPLSGPRGRMDTEPPDRAPKMSNYLASGVRGWGLGSAAAGSTTSLRGSGCTP